MDSSNVASIASACPCSAEPPVVTVSFPGDNADSERPSVSASNDGGCPDSSAAADNTPIEDEAMPPSGASGDGNPREPAPTESARDKPVFFGRRSRVSIADLVRHTGA